MVDLGKAMRSKIQEALQNGVKLGLRNLEWDMSLTMMPTPSGLQPAYMVLIRTPSMVLGEKITGVAIIGNFDSNQKEINKVIDQTFHNLRDAYAKSGAISNGESPNLGGGLIG
jgi:hypothetical protein